MVTHAVEVSGNRHMYYCGSFWPTDTFVNVRARTADVKSITCLECLEGLRAKEVEKALSAADRGTGSVGRPPCAWR